MSTRKEHILNDFRFYQDQKDITPEAAALLLIAAKLSDLSFYNAVSGVSSFFSSVQGMANTKKKKCTACGINDKIFEVKKSNGDVEYYVAKSVDMLEEYLSNTLPPSKVKHIQSLTYNTVR